ncbi:MAG: T9SS type A sorting domain-containing protein [Bacteroidota bacterium]
MKKALLFLFILFQINASFAQNVGDTIRVQAFNYNSATRDTLISFPNNASLTFEKILLKYNMRCKNALVSNATDRNLGCGEWDYSCNTFVADSSKIEKVIFKQPNYVVSNFTGNSYAYTSQQTYNHYDFTQKNVALNTIISENPYAVGSGSVVVNNLVKTNLKSGRTQILIRASQLISSGFSAGAINAINLNVANAGGLAKFLKLKIKSSSLTSLQAQAIDFNGFTEVYFRDYTFVNGANRIQFHTPFNWDGTSNIILEMSFSNSSNGTPIEFSGYSNPEIRTLSASNIASIDVSASGYVNINTQFFNSINTQLSVSFWTKGDADLLPVDCSIIYAYSSSIAQRQLNLHMPWGGQVYFDCGYVDNDFDRIVKPYGTDNVIEGVWNHWTFTKNTTSGVMNIYLNGALWHTGTNKTRVMSIMNFFLGKFDEGAGARYYKGQIRELTVWDKELTAGTILNWKNKTIDASHPDYANLVAYYKLDEETGQLVTDTKNGLTSTGINLLWNYERGDQLTTTFTESTTLPNITFYRGTYSQTVSDVVVRYSYPKNARIVSNYSITSNEGVLPMLHDGINLLSTTNLFDAIAENVYDGDTGTVISTLPVTTEGTINIVELDYFKRFPFYNELVSFVTPYGIGLDLGQNGKSWYFDMSDYVTLLKGNKRLVMSGGVWQEELDLEFLFIVGTPPRNVVQYDQLWQGEYRLGSPNINEIIAGTKMPTNNYAFNAAATSFKLKSSITGHGAQGEFSQNGGVVGHRILVNNVMKFNWAITQACSENPIFPQGGTWVYNRQGWCPGQRTLLKEQDLTPHVTAGTTMALDYRTSNPAVPTGDYRYISAHQVVGYGAPNFSLDAAIEQIKAPNNANAEYLRINPMCERPRVVVRNTGATTITTIDFTYWINNASTHQTYTWTGSLPSMSTTEILLPVNTLWSQGVASSNNKFHVQIMTMNSSADMYPNNNHAVSSFTLPDVMPSVFKIQLRTNNAPSQNNFTLYDSSGNVVDAKTFTTANTTYTYTYQTPQITDGCYRLRVNDTGNDGLQWWANTAQGAGYVRFLNQSDAIIKTFTPDFGGGFDYSFSVNSLLANEIFAVEDDLKVYPNPSNGQFSVESDALEGSKISVYTILGNLVVEKMATGSLVSFDQTQLSSGVYLVKVEKEKQTQVKRLIIN